MCDRRDALMQQRVSSFLVSACVLNFCETNIWPTCRECGAGEGLHGRSHRRSRHRVRCRPHCGKSRRHHSTIGEIVGAIPGLGQFVKRLKAASGQERVEFNVLFDQRHRRYRGGRGQGAQIHGNKDDGETARSGQHSKRTQNPGRQNRARRETAPALGKYRRQATHQGHGQRICRIAMRGRRRYRQRIAISQPR